MVTDVWSDNVGALDLSCYNCGVGLRITVGRSHRDARAWYKCPACEATAQAVVEQSHLPGTPDVQIARVLEDD